VAGGNAILIPPTTKMQWSGFFKVLELGEALRGWRWSWNDDERGHGRTQRRNSPIRQRAYRDALEFGILPPNEILTNPLARRSPPVTRKIPGQCGATSRRSEALRPSFPAFHVVLG